MTAGWLSAGVRDRSETCWKYGQSSFVHARFSSQMAPTSGLLALFEMMAPQEVYGGGIVFQHMSAQTLRDTKPALGLLDDARAKGIHVLAEVLPTHYGASVVCADYLVPENYGPNMGRSYNEIIETATLMLLTKDRYDELVKTSPMTSIMFYNAQEADVLDGLLVHPSSVLKAVTRSRTPFVRQAELAIDWDTAFDSVNGTPPRRWHARSYVCHGA